MLLFLIFFCQTEGHLNDVVSFLLQQTFINNVAEECLANCEVLNIQMPMEDADATVVLSEEQIYRYLFFLIKKKTVSPFSKNGILIIY